MLVKEILLVFVGLLFLFFIFLFGFYYYPSDNIYKHGRRNENKIALTFDDGPVENTERILEILENNNVSASFFVLGIVVEENPEIFQKLVDSGNEIASHGYSHLKLNLRFSAVIEQEIKKTDEILDGYGISNSLFRPSHGFISFILNNQAKRSGKKIIKWDVNSYDYKNPGTEKIVDNVLNNVQNGSIILMHDYAYYENKEIDNFEALRILIPELKKKYELVSVSELLSFK